MRRARLIVLAALAALAAAAPARAQRVMEIQVAPPLLRLSPGANVRVLATAYDRDGVPVEARLIWTSTNINVATVDSTGIVRAVANGIAIITAATDSAATRRRYGRTTVFVGSPSTWTGGRPGGKTIVPGDTLPPAECDDPEFGMRNPGRSCWDVVPTPRGSTVLEAPASCERQVRPVIFQVRVGPDGRVRERRTINDSGCEEYLRLAIAALDQVCCNPAYRNGRPVAAWTVVSIRPRITRIWVSPTPPMPVVPQVAPPTPPATPRGPAPVKQGPRP